MHGKMALVCKGVQASEEKYSFFRTLGLPFCQVKATRAVHILRAMVFDRAPPPKGVIFLPGVFLNDDDYNFDIALRRFKKQVEKAGVLSEMKKRQHYEKPSVMRKKKKAAARKRLMKKIRKMNMA